MTTTETVLIGLIWAVVIVGGLLGVGALISMARSK
jgi:hypothetical protein